MLRPRSMALMGFALAAFAACSDDPPVSEDAGALDAAARLDAAVDAGGSRDAGADGGLSDAGTCTSTVVPASAPPVQVTEPYLYELTEPTGPYAVGTHIIHLTDPSRSETATLEPDDKRRIVVQLYYPSDVRDGPIAPLMESEVAAQLVLSGQAPTDFERHVRTHTSFDLPLSTSQAKWPVLSFSHGLWGLREDDVELLSELASRGFIVASVSHPYTSLAVRFADGTLALTNLPALPSGGPELVEAFEGLKVRIENDQVPDVRFLLDQISRWNAEPCTWLSGRLDTDRIGVLGYSFGGATAFQVCTRDARCQAGINIDGWNFGSALERTDVPLMMIHSDRLDPGWDAIHRQLDGAAYSARIFNSGHPALSGRGTLIEGLFPNLVLSSYGFGTLAVRRTEEIYRRYVLAFVDEHVRGVPAPLLEQASPFPEARFEKSEAGVVASVTVLGNVTATTGFLRPYPVEGASVRLLGTNASTTADARGLFRFDDVAPVDDRISILVEDSTLFPSVFSFPFRGRSIDELGLVLPTAQKLGRVLVDAGVSLLPDRGHVVILAVRAPFDIGVLAQEGVQVVSTSTSARVVYGNLDELLPALTETEAGGGAHILNVEPGLWTGTVTHPSLVCESVPGGAPLSPGELVADVVAGAFSYLVVYCK